MKIVKNVLKAPIIPSELKLSYQGKKFKHNLLIYLNYTIQTGTLNIDDTNILIFSQIVAIYGKYGKLKKP